MTTFKTTDGAEWKVAVNVATVKRVRDTVGLNLLGLVGDSAVIADAFRDDLRIAETLAAVVKPQLDAAGKTADDFYAVIDGAVIESAAEALLREIVNFFQEPRRSVLLAAMEKVQATARARNEEGAAAALKALEEMEVELPNPSTLTSSALSSPASAA